MKSLVTGGALSVRHAVSQLNQLSAESFTIRRIAELTTQIVSEVVFVKQHGAVDTIENLNVHFAGRGRTSLAVRHQNLASQIFRHLERNQGRQDIRVGIATRTGVVLSLGKVDLMFALNRRVGHLSVKRIFKIQLFIGSVRGRHDQVVARALIVIIIIIVIVLIVIVIINENVVVRRLAVFAKGLVAAVYYGQR